MGLIQQLGSFKNILSKAFHFLWVNTYHFTFFQ